MSEKQRDAKRTMMNQEEMDGQNKSFEDSSADASPVASRRASYPREAKSNVRDYCEKRRNKSRTTSSLKKKRDVSEEKGISKKNGTSGSTPIKKSRGNSATKNVELKKGKMDVTSSSADSEETPEDMEFEKEKGPSPIGSGENQEGMEIKKEEDLTSSPVGSEEVQGDIEVKKEAGLSPIGSEGIQDMEIKKEMDLGSTSIVPNEFDKNGEIPLSLNAGEVIGSDPVVSHNDIKTEESSKVLDVEEKKDYCSSTLADNSNRDENMSSLANV